MDKFEQEAQALEEKLLREEEAELGREKYAACALKLVAQLPLLNHWVPCLIRSCPHGSTPGSTQHN